LIISRSLTFSLSSASEDFTSTTDEGGNPAEFGRDPGNPGESAGTPIGAEGVGGGDGLLVVSPLVCARSELVKRSKLRITTGPTAIDGRRAFGVAPPHMHVCISLFNPSQETMVIP
jgi:hypothetical protein